MGMFLNNLAPFSNYKKALENPYFIDKSSFIEDLLNTARTNQYICITRPRRFGKTVMANMLGAFLSNSEDSSGIFENLRIANSPVYHQHLNKHTVIFIDFSRMPSKCDTYNAYIDRIENGLKSDLLESYPHLHLDARKSLWDIFNELFSKNGQEKFVFIIDEWDALFHMPFASERDKQSYLLFLKSLLKDQEYIELAYMTGILPIAKYSDGSELNMFAEYDMATKIRFSDYFGFSEAEVNLLYERYLNSTKDQRITRDDLMEWYDGYHTASGERMYNPRSVVSALTDNQLANYWTSSGTYDSIFFYVKNNISDVQDDLALMVSGERVEARIQEYAASSLNLQTRDQIYSAMVVYGLLTYEDGEVFIPNKELMLKFEEMLLNKSSLGYVYRLTNESSKMLKATLAGDTQTMSEILQYAHNTETPILSYNNEVELSSIVNLVYLSARDKYRIEREDKAGKGYVDFIFYPVKKQDVCIILELKVDHSPEDAIRQIKEKQYALRLQGKLGEDSPYTGRILLVGISYSTETKEHFCKVEWAE